MKACILFAALLPLGLFSQKPLVVGDTLPLSAFSLTNDGGGSLRLPDNSKKLILLDFWATNCVGCIASFPKMEKLQERFKDEIQIILVNPETADSTRKFLAGRRFSGKKPSLPMISGSALLNNWIPFDFVPWEVWINQQGIIKYITEGYDVTEENISSFIETGFASMGQLYANALFDEEDIQQKAVDYAIAHRLQYYSLLSKKIPGRYWLEPDKKSRDYSIFATKGPVSTLIKEAFSENGSLDLLAENSIALEVSEPLKYKRPADKKDWPAWMAENEYTYFLIVSGEKEPELYPMARQELCRLFNVTASIEKRKTECYGLVATGEGKDFRWNSQAVERPKEHGFSDYRNVPFSDLVNFLKVKFRMENIPQPFINATGYSGNIDIRISASAVTPALHLDMLRKELNQFGLDIVKLYTDTEVLVIKEKENK